jgi:pyruvate,orthophosphate dikinase
MCGMKRVYAFDEVGKGNTRDMIVLLGNKGAQLAEMTAAGLPVPPGFTITTVMCTEFYRNGHRWPDGLEDEVAASLKEVERKTGREFGGQKPLLFSVRSGSYVSMPGMMDTVLNIGLNDGNVAAFAGMVGERCAWDSYRRLVSMFGDVVMGASHASFEKALEEARKRKGVRFDTELGAPDLEGLVKEFKAIVRKETGKDFPQDAWVQLRMAIDAVFNSWNIPRAVSYRNIHGIAHDAGTGVNVQMMVFGNMGQTSASGVGFTRNPSTGGKERFGEYLLDSQGEDVVAGIRTPKGIEEMRKDLPEAYEELARIYDTLEKHYREMQDFEFTIEAGKLYLLQTRKGKRTAQAAVRIAVDMAGEGLITREEAVMRIEPEQLGKLLHPQLDSGESARAGKLGKGLAASPGAAVGRVAFSPEKAVEMSERGEPAILVRAETSPDDIQGMHAAKGILTSRGGITSHAAVVARGMGKPCVTGCSDIQVDEGAGVMRAGGAEVREGDWISIDGGTGEVLAGRVRTAEPQLRDEFATLMGWADGFRRLRVRTNADLPRDCRVARRFGAEGIGLTRTEHMFFEDGRIGKFREMILATTKEDRVEALAKLMPLQKSDFVGIFREMQGLPVTIRLLDPPLHEFLPKTREEAEDLSKATGIPAERIMEAARSLHEFNPMLGHRGCRLGISYPEIYEMQVRAIMEAAMELKHEGVDVLPEIEIPLVSHVNEFRLMRRLVDGVANDVMNGSRIPYRVGTMIELPRACMTAGEIAREADFFSFGTNDLTQTAFGFSRDDSGRFIRDYNEKKVMAEDPFRTLDREGVGALMRICVEQGRAAKKGLEIGICGEQGGEAASVEFCHQIGLDYVSCSPFRVPIARLAAAQASIKGSGPGEAVRAA